MRVFRKLLVVLAAIAIVGALAIAAAFTYLPETDLIRDGLREKLSRLTGREVSVGSLKVSFAFPALIHIKLKDITVASKNGEPLLSTQSAELSPSLLSLLKGRVDVESVTVIGLRGFVRRSPERPVEEMAAGETGVPDESVGKGPAQQAPPVRPTHPIGPEAPAESRAARQVSWSVTSVKLVNCGIDWIDGKTMPGEELKLSVRDLNGSLARDKSGKSFTFNLDGTIGDGSGQQRSPVGLDGTIRPNDDMTALKSALINCRAEGLAVKLFAPYLPAKAAGLARFDRANLRGALTWKKNQPANISLSARLRTDTPEPAQLDLQGDVVANDSFSVVDSVAVSGETDLLPLKFVTRFVPASVPLDPAAGSIKAGIQATWKKDGTWQVKGSMGLEDAVPDGPLRGLEKRIRVWVQFGLDPDKLNLESLEISRTGRMASIRGTIGHPFSDRREIDLSGEVNLQPRWLPAAGVKLPSGLRLGGVIPLTGRVKTRGKAFSVTLDGDLVPAHIGLPPHAEKKSGAKGHVAFKGTIVPGKRAVGVGSHGALRLGLDGVAVHLKPGVKSLTGATVQWSSRIAVTPKGIDLKDAVVAVKQGPASPDLIRAEGNLTALGSKLGRIDGSARMVVDNEILALAGYKAQHGWTLVGTATLRAKFAGTTGALAWEIEGPLDRLGISVENAFKKAEGVRGELKAAGKWADKELVLTGGHVSLPGVVVTGRGLLLDRNGVFHDLTLNLKRTDAKALAALIPPLEGKGLSGPVEATLRLSRSDKGIARSGVIRPAALTYHPPKAEWWLDSLKGTVTVKGEKVEFPKIVGRVHGAIEAPFSAAGTINHVSSPETMTGKISVDLGHGALRPDRVPAAKALDQVRRIVGAFLNRQASRSREDLFDFEYLKGDFDLKPGTVRTEDLRLKGNNVKIGAIGSLQLGTQELDAFAGVHTVVSVNRALGEVPIVRDTVKKHSGLLKALGVDKELKRFGIDVDASKSQGEKKPEPVRSPLTLILKISGKASSPKTTPILEHLLDKKTAARLKALIE